ncbi:polyprenyl synthetase family protein [Sphingomonas histidinilytica]|uniref:Farnesyl diphosphate synthase n=1 Tax=Rhizorhabdus histidinilytica TaxID=439228 RepID=A0A1T4ZX54_9SPHN|nr:farnesyl diphosphate synthase [Rhizorhabdus histidinilytica]MBO9380367.1 polyprenyl synthetase family protein [Rhizorhabdus histidinilytica]SKB27147.1 farnesyl diphosphate synthase [Rhizorhabdus histidinilytica]
MSALLASELARIAQEIDARFDALLTPPDDSRRRLYEAMRHAAIGGGKRLRPLLTSASARLFAVDPECAIRAGLAIEAIHVYSLIHDDLPAMDDDDLRRGRPTVHRAYDEATAILAGDGFQALAFEIAASEATHPDPFVRSELVAALAAAAGPAGMVGGQAMDMAAEAGGEHDLDTVSRLQQLKTGALIGFSIEAGAILGRVPPEGRVKLRAYAHDLGLAFQIADDLLDAEGDPAAMGKAAGKDDAAGKATFVGLLGVDRARAQARLLSQQAIDHLGNFGREADLLRDIAAYVVDRDR